MSEEEKPKPAVCDRFEPQAWRKTVCKNCFQHPDVHTSGGNQNGVDNKNGVDLKEHRAGSADKGEKSAASSLKEKYEQLEKEKYKSKDVESHTLPRTKKASGLALITDKYDQLDRLAGKLDSPTKGVPPPTPPKTYKKEKDGGGLTKHKFGSVENVSNDAENTDIKIGLKFKFGSMENISQAHDKRKDALPIPLPKSKDKSIDIASKLDSFQNEVKSGATSKSGQTVIHKQKDGNVDIITIPSKQKGDDKKTQPSEANTNKSSLVDKIDSMSEKAELTSKDDDKVSSKFGLKSKFDLKSPTPDKEKQPDFKLAKDLLSSSKDDTHSKDKSESDDKSLKTGFKKPELKSAQPDKEKDENKLSSLKDKLNKTSSTSDKEDSKLNTTLKKNQEDSNKTDKPNLNDRKPTKLNFKDQLKSPDTDDSPLSKFKDKLKSPTVESDNKQVPSWKDKMKSPVTDNKPDFKLKSDLKSPTPEKDKVPEFKLKAQLRSSSSDKEAALKNQLESNKKTDVKGKESLKSQPQENDNKTALNFRDSLLKSKTTDKKSSDDLKTKNDIKKQTSVEDSSTPTNKTFDLRSGLKKATDNTSKDSETNTTDTKKKAELPYLKSKSDSFIGDKNVDNKSKFGAKDEKVPNKLESKFKLGKLGLKNENEDKEKAGSKNTFPKLKSVDKSTDDLKPSLKSKFETKEKAEEQQNVPKNKFEIPALKKVKSPEPEPDIKSVNETKANKTDDETKKTPTSNLKDTEKVNIGISKTNELENQTKENQMPKETSSNKTDTDNFSNKQSTNLESSSRGDFQNNVDKDKKDRHELDTKESNSIIAPDTSVISKKNFDSISSDTEVISSDACAVDSTREKSPLHVDTQVFTSSRSKTAGVISLDDKHFDNLDNASGFSGLELKKSKSGSPGRDKGAKDFLVNGDISTEHEESKYGKEKSDKIKNSELKSAREIEELKAELLNMTERCQNLETENEMLRGDLGKKGVTENNLRKQRDEVENAIKGLRAQLKTLEEKCTHLETENINLSNDLKLKYEDNHNKPHTKETEEMEEKLTTKEKIMDDMIEENEQLKQEINELKVEMEEMYDTFRDQEAEEFREMQKELEFTAKNCRILQFKLRKIERRNEQLEQDKNQFEDRLRKLQNSFQDRDAVSHIHSLEDELRLAKEVSVRLHDELDLMEDRRTKIEEENRHLTELLEQADRKQFRLELEVDKLRDKVVELRQELRMREGGPEGEEPRKVSLQLIGKQASLEHEIAELKREMYDGKERELDLKEQLQFLETNNKKIQNKVRDLEDENDNLCKQLKSMSKEKAADVESRDQPKTEAEVELKIQLELSEKELKTLKKNLAGIDEENEMLHRELFLLEKRLKEQERQLRIMPRPSSPQTYYEDRIKEYEREANEFRSKLLDKENEIERLYAQMQSLQFNIKRAKDLRKSRSLDLEIDYSTVVEVKRQLELEQQENEVLKEKITNLKEDKHALVEEISVLEERIARGQTSLTALAVAYVDTEDEAKLRTQLRLMEVSQSLLLERIQSLVKLVLSLCEANISKAQLKQVLEMTTISTADEIIESTTDTRRDKGTSASVGRPTVTNSNSGNFSELNTFTCSKNLEFPGTTHYLPSDEEVLKYKQRLIESRDPDKLLCFLEEIYSVLIERLNGMQIEMDSDSVEVVPSDQNGRSDSPEIEMFKSDIKESDPEEFNTMSDKSEKDIEECNIVTTTTTNSKIDETYRDTKVESDLLCESSLEIENVCDDVKIQSDTVSVEVTAPMTASHQTSTDDPSVIAPKIEEHDAHRIAFLQEEIGPGDARKMTQSIMG